MAGQAARKTRSQITSAMNKLDMSLQKKTASGGDPVMHPNTFGNPSLGASGKITDENKKIKIQGYC